jgi:hypothetical protein
MSSLRQIDANRRNARLSTGPVTDEGKNKSRQNAVRHGLTAETVIGALEDAEDYAAFEMTITADYEAQTAVERELVLRLASLLWRLRRATAIETGLFEIQARHLFAFRRGRDDSQRRQEVIDGIYRNALEPYEGIGENQNEEPEVGIDCTSSAPAPSRSEDATHSFLRLANLPACPLDRLSRYEATLWRQACQVMFSLQCQNRRNAWRRQRPPPYRELQGDS